MEFLPSGAGIKQGCEMEFLAAGRFRGAGWGFVHFSFDLT
jgi:hypothetical protein